MITKALILRLFNTLRNEMKERWNRFVPVGELLEDRWSRAKAMGFGEGSNAYDSAVILGNVTVGKHCWVGPNTYLDGSGELTIGDHVTIGVGSTLFSHLSLPRDLSAGAYPSQYKPTHIGNHVFMAPYCVVEMGADIGDYCVIMSHSVVKRPIPPHSIVHGNPARIIGQVILEDGKPPAMRFNREGISIVRED